MEEIKFFLVSRKQKRSSRKALFFLPRLCRFFSPFLFPPNKRGKKKKRMYNQNRGKKNNAFLLDRRKLLQEKCSTINPSAW